MTSNSPTQFPSVPSVSAPVVAPVNNEAAIVKTLEYRVLRLLCSQYRATGNTKSESALTGIRHRIERLGGRAPFIAVRQKKVPACVGLVQDALALIPLLGSYGKFGSILDGWFVNSVSCALADAFKVASGDMLLGFEIDVLHRLSSETIRDLIEPAEVEAAISRIKQEKYKIIDAMALPLSAYCGLLEAIIPLACDENPICGLWLRDQHHAGKPLPHLADDVREIARLSPHIHPASFPKFNWLVNNALRALSVRRSSPVAPASLYSFLPALAREAIEARVAEKKESGEANEEVVAIVGDDLDVALEAMSTEQLEALNAEIAAGISGEEGSEEEILASNDDVEEESLEVGDE
jgi:hypothetical protein